MFAFVLYGAGKLESQGGTKKGIIWAALSVTVSVIAIRVCGGGWITELLAQVALFVGIGAVRSAIVTKKAVTLSGERAVLIKRR